MVDGYIILEGDERYDCRPVLPRSIGGSRFQGRRVDAGKDPRGAGFPVIVESQYRLAARGVHRGV